MILVHEKKAAIGRLLFVKGIIAEQGFSKIRGGMVHKGLYEPHVLLASSNPRKLMRNLEGILTPVQISKVQDAVNKEVKALYRLAENHRDFALSLGDAQWRQIVSRLYYAAYNAKRALTLSCEGVYSTDSSDHKKVELLPDDFVDKSTYSNKLKNLREDRNLCDYSHLAGEADLILPVVEVRTVVSGFMVQVKEYLGATGVVV